MEHALGIGSTCHQVSPVIGRNLDATMLGMPDPIWPPRWQADAIEAVRPHVNADLRLEILVGDPALAIHGTLIAGYVYVADDGTLMIIHDHSGRPGIFPWRVLSGPVLRVTVLQPHTRRRDVYILPEWKPPRRAR
jgi:hypothetical protein